MRRPEQELQKAVIQYIRYQAPNVLCFHVPNGGKRSPVEAGIFKAMGVMPGVADLLLFWAGPMAINGMPAPRMGSIELKASKGRQTESQKRFAARWSSIGGRYAVCWSLEEVRETLKRWGVIS